MSGSLRSGSSKFGGNIKLKCFCRRESGTLYILSNASNNHEDENVPVWFCWYSSLSLFI